MQGLTAKHIMIHEVLAVGVEWSLKRVAEFLIENSISGAPVKNEAEEIVGVVSLTDLVHQSTQPDQEELTPHDYYLQELNRQCARSEAMAFSVEGTPLVTVESIMTPTIYHVTEDTPVPKVAENMLENRIHRVFVTRKGKVVGIISTPDMLKVIRDM